MFMLSRISTRAFRTVLTKTRVNARPITPIVTTVRCISTTPTIEPKGKLGEDPLSTLPDILQEPTQVNALLASTHYRAVGRMMELTPVLKAWLETLKTSVGVDHKLKGRDYATFNSEIQNAYRAKVKELYSANRCNPRVSFLLPWVQIPLFVTMSLTIRGMAGYPLPFIGDSTLPAEPGFAEGGTLWFTDLAASDPTWIMPIAIGATNLLNVELNGMMMSKTPTRNQVIFRNIFRALAISMIPIAHEAPMAICLYWMSSGSYSVLQNIAFRMSPVRVWLKMPPLPKRVES
ncbi:Cytochrome c oxidase assembly protein cox18, mitochondrial [Podila epicladia]|nr:Cytochrome c oxidase assembly protein cox18, mitochondrial [Podila epicladia]